MIRKKLFLLSCAAVCFSVILAHEGSFESTSSEIPVLPLEKHSEFSATTKKRDTLFLCPSRNEIANTIKESWERGVYDEPDQTRPVIIVLTEEDYDKIVEPRIQE
jgi:hypothetical protein